MNTQETNKVIAVVLKVVGGILAFLGGTGNLMMLAVMLFAEAPPDNPSIKAAGVFAGLTAYTLILIPGIWMLKLKPESLPVGAAWGPFLLNVGRKIVGWYVIYLGGLVSLAGLVGLFQLRFMAVLVGGLLGSGLIWCGLKIAGKRKIDETNP